MKLFNRDKAKEGTEENPILRGSRDNWPAKYQCIDCQKWFIEPEYDVWIRGTGSTSFDGTSCSECAAKLVKERWEDLTKRNCKSWDDLTKGRQA